ncbi:hypothetical protein E3C22_13550 [Jiella endophytica]|uniref:Uncharacterized protein n=1 Tax=Jiella endophytica TaxID=2558362 RepID=A0A4Y8RG46_9HYPH|nr:hypothetical protein [Jiella endophytica]TFF21712.1 hypothetical protein E3C22_13550 [Jiella endophytica]
MRCLLACLASLLLIAAGGPAHAASGQSDGVQTSDGARSSLVGWWISLGPLSAGLAGAGLIVPSVEVLVVSPDGRFEDRFFRFTAPSRELCADTRWCSDMALAWRAKLAPADDHFKLEERVAGEDVIDRAELDGMLRGAAVGALTAWNYKLDTDGRRLVLNPQNPATARVFARIEPRRLQRLVAAFVMSDETGRRWPCFVGNAEAGDPAFATLHGDAADRPDWFDDFLAVASYQVSITTIVTDDASLERQEPATLPQPLERRLVETFERLAPPGDAAERKQLRDRFVSFRRAGMGAEAPELAEEAAAPALTAGEIRTFAKVMADKQSDSFRRLFCSDQPAD